MTAEKQVRISIIVPVYNTAAYLPRCVDSIVNQSFRDFELILVDDGSADNSGELCDRYAEKDPRIHVIHQANANSSAARNAGLDMARGEWIAFIDSDDWVHREYLKTLLSGAEDGTDVVICGSVQTEEASLEDKPTGEAVFKTCDLQAFRKNHLFKTRIWGRLYRRSAIGDLRFVTGAEPIEDSFFNAVFFDEHTRVSASAVKLYYYYMRDDSAIHDFENGRKRLTAVETILTRLDSISDRKKRSYIAQLCCKSVLSSRYVEKYSPDYPTIRTRCDQLFSQLDRYWDKSDRRTRSILHILFRFPGLYRAQMILADPTLLVFEKNRKAAFRARTVGTGSGAAGSAGESR